MFGKVEKVLLQNRAIYDEIVSGAADEKRRSALIRKLIRTQKRDGFWYGIKPSKCESEMRVDFVYFPTYYATAAMIYADLNGQGLGRRAQSALQKGLEAATGRNLEGHGFGAVRGQLDALAIYKKAGIYRFIGLYGNYFSIYGKFIDMIHRILKNMENALEGGNTVADWQFDFKELYEAELAEYRQSQVCRISV